MRIPYTISPQSITVFVDGKIRTVLSGTKSFDNLRDHLKKPEHDINLILKLSSREQEVQASVKGYKVTVKDGTVYYEGEELHNTLTDKLLHMLDSGFDPQPWVKFLERLMTNPSYRSRGCLFDFLEKFSAPITPDGKFIAFKRVSHNWKDLHTHTILNTIGTTVSMDRSKVDDDPNHTCSAGLHVCADEYLKGYATGTGCRTLVVEVDPANVVSVPHDYNFSKMRVCEYKVLAEICPEQIPETLSEAVYDASKQQGRDKYGRFLPK